MSVVAISGSDSIILLDRILTGVFDGNYAELTFPNELMTVKTGKNKNTVYSQNMPGENADLVLRMVKGDSDDKWLNGLLSQQQRNPAGFPLIYGEFNKAIGDGKGNIITDTYVLVGGVFVKRVEGRMNSDGETDASVSIYTLRFSSADRAIG